MLPTEEQMEAQAATHGVGQLLTGDLGVIAVRALLENGAGYVVSSWRDRPTPIDAAIDDARERVLAPHGIVLRRLRSLAALEPIVTAPSGGVTGAPPRGAVVFAGRRGMRPALEQFVRIHASGAVVGLCFDDDALRIERAIVIDPEPTAVGIMRAIDDAFAASRATGRPALVVLRERALGMRGTIRQRPALSPRDAAQGDATHRAAHGVLDVNAAATAVGLVASLAGADAAASRDHVVVAVGPIRQGVERALAELAATLRPAADAERVDAVALVATRAVGIDLAAIPEVGSALREARDVLVIGARAEHHAEQLRAGGVRTRVSTCSVDPGTVRGEQLRARLAGWIARHVVEDDNARASLEALAGGGTSAVGLVPAGARVPRRSETFARSVSPAVAAGLALAQGVIGVPGRVDVDYPTYQSDTGVPITVVPAALFAAHGASTAAPGTGAGVFVVAGSASGVEEAAGLAAASIEYVDGSSPRAIGAAIGRACRGPRAASHVIVVTEVQRVAAPRSAAFGMDPDLVGTERLATSAVPSAATVLVELGDELLAGPTVLALDCAEAHAALGPLRELSPATWDLRRPSAGVSSRRALAWNLRRRLMRAATGVDL